MAANMHNSTLAKQSQEIGKQTKRFLMGTKLTMDHDSSAQTLATLDESRVSHAENFRFNQQQHQQNQVLEQAFSSSVEREEEIVRLQKKMWKLQYKISKLQKRVSQLQNL